MIEEAANGIIETGVIAVVLAAGLIFMYRYFDKEIKRLNDIIRQKDEEILKLNEQLKDLMVKDIEVSTQLNSALESLTKVIENGQ